MKKTYSHVLENPKEFRKERGQTQTDFWKMFGLTQPGGSRYENGQPIPTPTAILLDLFGRGDLSEAQLQAARDRVMNCPTVADDQAKG